MAFMRTGAAEMAGPLGNWSGVALLLFTTGCAGSLYGWTVRTTSGALSPSSEATGLPQETVAVLTPLSGGSLRGNEAGIKQYLVDVLAAQTRSATMRFLSLQLWDTKSSELV